MDAPYFEHPERGVESINDHGEEDTTPGMICVWIRKIGITKSMAMSLSDGSIFYSKQFEEWVIFSPA